MIYSIRILYSISKLISVNSYVKIISVKQKLRKGSIYIFSIYY